MANGIVIPYAKYDGVAVPNGAKLMWNIPVSNPNGVLSDYFDLATGLGREGTAVYGYAICNGQNGTIDAIGRYLRGCNAAFDNIATTQEYSTALPTSSFSTATFNVTPSLSMSSNTTYPVGDGYWAAASTGTWSYDLGGDIGGSGDVYPRENTGSVYASNLYHNHTASFDGTSVSVGNQSISGGDSETMPNSIVFLLIERVTL